MGDGVIRVGAQEDDAREESLTAVAQALPTLDVYDAAPVVLPGRGTPEHCGVADRMCLRKSWLARSRGRCVLNSRRYFP